VRGLRLTARHAWPFLKHWNRPLNWDIRLVLFGQVFAMTWAAFAWGSGSVLYFAALFTAVIVAWTVRSVRTYRKEKQ
jgi:hypothetical protein